MAGSGARSKVYRIWEDLGFFQNRTKPFRDNFVQPRALWAQAGQRTRQRDAGDRLPLAVVAGIATSSDLASQTIRLY